MKAYKFRIYYEWHGPTKDDPFASEKSSDDLDWAFDRFPHDLEYRLDDREAIARLTRVEGTPDEAILMVSTIASEDHLLKALVANLQHWRLFGTKLTD